MIAERIETAKTVCREGERMVNDHETGYKDLFHVPELVQQLIEGFAPPSVAALMDFTTLSDHSGKDNTRCSMNGASGGKHPRTLGEDASRSGHHPLVQPSV